MDKTYSQAEFNAGIAGAYAAAAKHFPRLPFLCSCGFMFKDEGRSISELWCEHILALTPADARHAQREHFGKPSPCGVIGHLMIDYDAHYQGGPYCRLCRARECEKELVAARAAIASAEARARLEEAKYWRANFVKETVGGWGDSQSGDVRIAELEAELEAAARTPDSTKEPE